MKEDVVEQGDVGIDKDVDTIHNVELDTIHEDILGVDIVMV